MPTQRVAHAELDVSLAPRLSWLRYSSRSQPAVPVLVHGMRASVFVAPPREWWIGSGTRSARRRVFISGLIGEEFGEDRCEDVDFEAMAHPV